MPASMAGWSLCCNAVTRAIEVRWRIEFWSARRHSQSRAKDRAASTRLPSLRLALTASIVTRPRHLTLTQCAVADRSFAVRWTSHRIHIDCVQRGLVADIPSELFGSCALGALQ